MRKAITITVMLWLTLAALASAESQTARQRQLLDSGWRFHLNDVSGASTTTNGTSLTQWVWIADDNAPTDAATMAAPGLNTSTWTNVTVGTDVFGGRIGYAWFRTSITNLASYERPLGLYFLRVDDNATVYLNGIQVGQHSGWSEPFDLTLDPSWITNGMNVLAVAVQNTGGQGGIYGGVFLQSGPAVPPPGILVTQWLWLADNNATNDAATMTATNLNTSAWQSAAIGQDVFNGQVGYAWFRTTLDAVTSAGRPLTLHFLSVDDNAGVYLNGILLGKHAGGSQAFDIKPLDYAWASGGPNVLSVAVQNTGGPGGILGPVALQSGADLQPTGNPGSAQAPAAAVYDDSGWRLLNLPHDYIIEGTFTNTADAGHGSLPQNTAWYRKTFTIPASAQGQSIWIDFDGVYHDSDVWLNGNYLGNWWSGYAPFRYDISQFANVGGTNVLSVHVDPTADEGWWYEGGGIYRHVWLNIANPLHVTPSGAFVTANVQGPDANGNASAVLTIQTTVTNAAALAQSCTLVSQVVGPDGVSPGTATASMLLAAGAATNVVQTMPVASALLWSLDKPQLYVLHTTLQQANQPVDNLDTTFGIRTVRFDVNNGFFLNGKSVKLNGTCNHQDFAGVGIGMPDNLLYWRIEKLKAMGANAYRCSHNPPTGALLDACDRLGMLVMDETRHLGDATGTKSDASTPYSNLAELNSMILRDRNHPCVALWSMCNEEFAVQATQPGANMFYAMKQRVLQFDATRPISCAMNGGTGFGISLVEDLQGFNYNSGAYDSFHQLFPAQPCYASETTSATTDRGIYATDTNNGYVSAYNTTAEGSWQPVAARAYMAGGFVWTGFDYKGEPTPYGWPCVNSHFGIMDMCGLPKDSYYFYQAWWGTQPSVYIFPHWNWPTNGQAITVWCFANTPSVELFLNGVSQGVQTVPAYSHVAWTVPYAAGTLLAKGYSGGVTVATNQVVTTGLPASLRLTTDRATLTADGEDVTVVYAAVLDAQGLVVPTASNLVTFATAGAGWVAGVGNGDPSSHEPDRAAQRNAFNGWCMALVGATNIGGAVTLTATSPGLTPAVLNLQSLSPTNPPATPTGLAATAGNVQVKLNWTISFGANSYNIKRAGVSGGPYLTIANYTAITFTDKAATNGATYYYVVSAVNTNGESANSAEIYAAPAAPVSPPSPTGFVALPDDMQVGLNWNAVAGATSYNVKRSPAGSGPFTNEFSTSATSLTDTAVTNGTPYFYVVSAVGAGIESSNSAPVSVIPVTMSFLVGTITGTTGSWSNSGNTRERAMDGNLNTFFDAPSGNNDWVGLDLGTNVAVPVSKIRFCPRSTFSNRMIGGMFQGANASDFTGAATLYVLTNQPAEGAMIPLLIGNPTPFRYLRYLSPTNGFGNIAELEFYTPGPRISQVTGAIFGTVGTSNETSANVFDNDITTYYDSTNANGNWVGLDLGLPRVITNVRYCPRSGYDSVMLNGEFQGANVADFSVATNLLTLTNTPPDATLTAQIISNATAFRYVRYVSPTNSYGDIAEAQFFSSTPGLPAATNLPSAPTGLATTPGYEQVGLAWNTNSAAISYHVKRATVSGGPYTTIANLVASVCIDTGLTSGTYYYVVSSVNAAGESTNSTEASAVLTCPTSAAPSGLNVTAENGQLILTWSPLTEVSGYNLWRATNSGGPYALIAVGVAGSSWTDTTVTNRAVYYYEVQAINACGRGPNSSPASASLNALNVAPVLAPISNQHITAGSTMLVTNATEDLDVPPLTLSYGLLTSPVGAMINPATGLVSWRPAMAQSGTTNQLTVVVTNNGQPNLSAAQSFSVAVVAPSQPSFGPATFANGILQCAILGDSGPDYSVLGSTDLLNWVTILTTNPPSLPFLFTDPFATNRAQRFYRIQLTP